MIKEDDKTVISVQKETQREDSHISIIGKRPNINEISKRNAEAVKQERKLSYTVVGVIVLLIIAVMYLVYFVLTK